MLPLEKLGPPGGGVTELYSNKIGIDNDQLSRQERQVFIDINKKFDTQFSPDLGPITTRVDILGQHYI